MIMFIIWPILTWSSMKLKWKEFKGQNVFVIVVGKQSILSHKQLGFTRDSQTPIIAWIWVFITIKRWLMYENVMLSMLIINMVVGDDILLLRFEWLLWLLMPFSHNWHVDPHLVSYGHVGDIIAGKS